MNKSSNTMSTPNRLEMKPYPNQVDHQNLKDY